MVRFVSPLIQRGPDSFISKATITAHSLSFPACSPRLWLPVAFLPSALGTCQAGRSVLGYVEGMIFHPSSFAGFIRTLIKFTVATHVSIHSSKFAPWRCYRVQQCFFSDTVTASTRLPFHMLSLGYENAYLGAKRLVSVFASIRMSR
jgi:hypothetical protein